MQLFKCHQCWYNFWAPGKFHYNLNSPLLCVKLVVPVAWHPGVCVIGWLAVRNHIYLLIILVLATAWPVVCQLNIYRITFCTVSSKLDLATRTIEWPLILTFYRKISCVAEKRGTLAGTKNELMIDVAPTTSPSLEEVLCNVLLYEIW